MRLTGYTTDPADPSHGPGGLPAPIRLDRDHRRRSLRGPSVSPPEVWAAWPDEKLLDLRINQLGVTIEGSVLEDRIAALQS